MVRDVAKTTSAAAVGPARPRGDARSRITAAALDLFEEDGYGATTVDAVATRAGVARRTFFHHFRSKDDVVFPGHEALVARISDHLAGQPDGPGDEQPIDAVCEALRIVFSTYIEDQELALRRYRLLRREPELRAREIAWVHRYQLLFTRYLDERYRDDPHGGLAAEALGAGLVAIHNHVLRSWLRRGGGGDPMGELDEALAWMRHSFGLAQRGDRPPRLVVAVFDDSADPQDVVRRVERAIR